MKFNQSSLNVVKSPFNNHRKSHLSLHKFPVPYEDIQQYKKNLISTARTNFQDKTKTQIHKNTFRNSKQSNPNLNKFQQTRPSTFNQARGIAHRIMSSQGKFRSTYQSSNQQLLQRPSTQFRARRSFEVRARMNAYSPLQVIRTKMTEEMESVKKSQSHSRILLGQRRESLLNLQQQKYSTQIEQKKTFLKKGTSFDRTLLHNILKSKLKSKPSLSVENYSNAHSNDLLNSHIKRQIPNELRDIIGPEEMLRMSKILSGINVETVNMNEKIQRAITSRIVKKKLKTSESNVDDTETLKSIKRW